MAALLTLALLSAGCLAASSPRAADVPTNASAPLGKLPVANATTPAPVWKSGDAWSISTSGGGAQSEHSVLVVTSDSSDAYNLATTSATLATFDALFDISYIGKIRADDLAGTQGTTPVKFFDFPLADGKTWSTLWDNKTINITAKSSGAGAFAITAMDGAKTYASYDYQPAVKWWDRLEFAGGYVLKVDRFGENWTGEYRVATAKMILDSTTAIPVMTINSQPFTVDAAQTSVILSFFGGSSAYARGYALQDPSNAPYQGNATPADAQPTGGGVAFQETLPPTPGTWHIEAPTAHAPGGFFRLTIHEIRVDLRHR